MLATVDVAVVDVVLAAVFAPVPPEPLLVIDDAITTAEADGASCMFI